MMCAINSLASVLQQLQKKIQTILSSKILMVSFFYLIFNMNVYSLSSAGEILNMPLNANQLLWGYSAKDFAVDSFNYSPASTTPLNQSEKLNWQAGISYHTFFEGINFMSAAASIPVSQKVGSFGLALASLDYGPIANYDVNGNDNGSFTASEFLAIGNYSRLILRDLSMGVNFKFQTQSIADISAQSYSSDIGFRYFFFKGGHPFWFEVSAQNIGTALTFITESSPLPSSYGGSFSYSLVKFLPRWIDISVGPSGRLMYNGDFQYGVGSEMLLRYGKAEVYFKSGYRAGYGDSSFSIGGGLNYHFGKVKADLLSGVNPTSTLGGTYMFSGKLTGFKPLKSKLDERLKKRGLMSDLEIAREMQNFLTKNYDEDSRPEKVEDLLEDIKKKDGELPALMSGEILYVASHASVIYIADDEKNKLPHKVYTIEGSEFNGKILRIVKGMLVISTTYGEMKFPLKRITKLTDKQLEKAKVPTG